VNAARAQRSDRAAIGEHDALDGGIVGEHGDHHIAATSVRHRGSAFRPLLYQSLGFFRSAVINGYVVAGFEQVRRHARAHVPQPNESNFHVLIPVPAMSFLIGYHPKREGLAWVNAAPA
jgi:hypothetical protein